MAAFEQGIVPPVPSNGSRVEMLALEVWRLAEGQRRSVLDDLTRRWRAERTTPP